MFHNYILTGWRHIANNRLFSLINISGLAIGLMSCILILLFVSNELTYDNWIKDNDRIVRVHSAYINPGRPDFRTVRAPGAWAADLERYAPDQVESWVRIIANTTAVIKDGEAYDSPVEFADQSFFDVFDFPFVHGNPEQSFKGPLDLVVSEENAIRFFGRTDVVGETLTFCCLQNQQIELPIRGVIKDLPENSHMQIGMLVRMEESMFDFAPNLLKTYTSVNTYTYFKLVEGVTPESFKERIYTWLDTESPLVERFQGPDGQSGRKVTDGVQPNVMAVKDLYLHALPDAGNLGDMRPLGDIKAVYIFSAVAVLVLLIASINFMNLSTAKAAQRVREVALRKTMGATRIQVASQFLGEAVAICIIALLIALVGAEIVLPSYNEVIGRELELNFLGNLPMILALILVTIFVGVLSGLYPAAYLSRFMPAKTLKANQSSDMAENSKFRSILVVFQFAISIGLIICTAVIYGQTEYAKSFETGFDATNKLVLGNVGAAFENGQLDALKAELENIDGVKSVSFSSEVPSQDFQNNSGFRLLDTGEDNPTSIVLNNHSMGYGFFEAYKVDPVAGRLFDEGFGTDAIVPREAEDTTIGSASVILNESAVRSLGIASPEDAIGRILRADVFRSGTQDLTIIGVIPDIYFRSIKFGIRPSAYFLLPNSFDNATVVYDQNYSDSVISRIETLWQGMFPLYPVSYEYLAVMMDAQYQAEEGQAKLFAAFSILAVLIACFGLYGLAAFTAERRTKEIGIRKVLGANTFDIIKLLVWQFSRPVLLANLIALPLSWYLMSDWLEGFRYRLDDSFIIGFAIFSGGLALSIAWTTVAGRAFRVAQAKPIKALRYE